MSYALGDGAWLAVSKVSRYECTKCGNFLTTRYPQNDREMDETVRKHAIEFHKGFAPRY